jgi:hypothetical protein
MKTGHAEFISAAHLQLSVRYLLAYFGRSLRAGLYAHTAQALGTGPVSAPIPNANCLNLDF